MRRYSITILLLLCCASQVAATNVARKGMVATVHPLATEAGLSALEQGGNAVDAAVAAALMLGVVDAHNSGIGGGCFILLREPDGSYHAIDGREMAPAKAHAKMYLRDGQPRPQLSKLGVLASGTPGALAAYDVAVREHGRLPLRDSLTRAAHVAEQGFRIDRMHARAIKAKQRDLARFDATRETFLNADGSPPREGDTLRRPSLARTYRAVAERGVDAFYHGTVAQQVERWMANNGGILTAADFAAYESKTREPLVTTYRGYTIVGFPPPSSGGVHVAQILNILEHFDLGELHKQSPATAMHVIVEAMKLAFADRAHWLGDADFAPVPRGLVSKEYAASLARKIDLRRATPVTGHGLPPAAESDLFNKHTTHIAAADTEGYWVAITATINTHFGSKVVIPGTGVLMNNQMDDFSIQPGVPNTFGLLGAKANEIAPGKRPLSSMSPTIVLKDGKPIMTLGAAGGPTIITQVVLNIVRRLDFGLSLPDALAAPRVHHQWRPDEIRAERGVGKPLLERLDSLGHTISTRDRFGVSQAIEHNGDRFIGVHDPRVPGWAAGR